MADDMRAADAEMAGRMLDCFHQQALEPAATPFMTHY
jgi:hypothetical protein